MLSLLLLIQLLLLLIVLLCQLLKLLLVLLVQLLLFAGVGLLLLELLLCLVLLLLELLTFLVLLLMKLLEFLLVPLFELIVVDDSRPRGRRAIVVGAGVGCLPGLIGLRACGVGRAIGIVLSLKRVHARRGRSGRRSDLDGRHACGGTRRLNLPRLCHRDRLAVIRLDGRLLLFKRRRRRWRRGLGHNRAACQSRGRTHVRRCTRTHDGLLGRRHGGSGDTYRGGSHFPLVHGDKIARNGLR